MDQFQGRGRYSFTDADVARVIRTSAVGRQAALRRLKAKRRIASPRRGFYVVIPVEYRTAGSPPAAWFVDDLMRFLKQPYYVGLLTAAALHGAAHQQPIAFQIVTDRPTRTVGVGRVRLVFHVSRDVPSTPIVRLQTETGSMRVSTPEVTALDVVRFARAAGHLNNVATVLNELSETLNADELGRVAGRYAVADVQRLGFILDALGKKTVTARLLRHLGTQRHRQIPLVPGQKAGGRKGDARWRVVPNERIEVDR